ncbi:hypothetical protein H5410_060934 [Solanum commersonii]|uniref:Gag-pol polyprotein n=1 Tax=Solanum commersonii TaxID=4109 RepID=A0A9J5W7K9_SOLCO|nr:hypothetical protein H5410_060934 [Solanum commersonii]
MPPRRAVRVRPAMKSVEEQELPNALEVQIQEEIKYADFCEAIRSSIIENTENFIEKLKRVFDVIHVAESERVELVAYQLKGVTRIWFDQWKKNRAEDAPVSSKEGKAAMLIGDIDIARFLIHLQQVEEDKLKDREEFKDKRAKIGGDEFRNQKNDENQSSLP